MQNRTLLALGAAAISLFALRKFTKPRTSFRNRVVFISGGSRGLGLILARRFADEGARIFICARTKDQLERARKELSARGAEVIAEPCDLRKKEEVPRVIRLCEERLGPIEVLVNNASIMLVGPFTDLGEEDFRNAMDANFWHVYHATDAVLPGMIQRRWGRILNITSIGGVISVPHLLPYCVGKFAAQAFSEGITAEAARYGVKVTTIVPGLMRTGSYLNALFKGEPEKEFSWFAAGASLPLISMDAERAGDKIFKALKEGRKILTVGAPAKFGRIFHGLWPGLTIAVLDRVSRALMPAGQGAIARLTPPEPGFTQQDRTYVGRSPMTVMGRRAASRFNERSI